MYANPEKNEYYAMVDRVRKHFGNAVEVGGYNSHDLNKPRKLDQKREADQAKERADQPAIEAGTRLHQTRQRVHRAWQKIGDAQGLLFKDRRVHEINGAPEEFFEKIDVPTWGEIGSSVEEIDARNEETAMLATKWEARAGKIIGYASSWASMTAEERNRSLILALAGRLNQLSGNCQPCARGPFAECSTNRLRE
jgi:hypothetical protein